MARLTSPDPRGHAMNCAAMARCADASSMTDRVGLPTCDSLPVGPMDTERFAIVLLLQTNTRGVALIGARSSAPRGNLLHASAQRAALIAVVLGLLRCTFEAASPCPPQRASPSMSAQLGAGLIRDEMLKDARKRIASDSTEPLFSAGGSGK
eukprot:5057957-Pyramimonas_sp.AAC.1